MSIPTDTLAFFRTQWATRYTDSCVVKRFATNVLNQTTGVVEPTYTTIYSGPCLVRPASAGEAQAGQELVATHDFVVSLPYTETAELPKDLVDVTSSTDPYLTGRQFVVTNIPGDTYITDRKLECQDVTSG